MITVTIERNGSHPDGEAQRTIGRYTWVQLTYRSLRTSPDGENFLLTWDAYLGYWVLESDGSTWSDVILG
jgi:hypothetical protein